MGEESENELQSNLINQLTGNNFDFVKIGNEFDLNENFKQQLSSFNNVDLNDEEFREFFNRLTGDSFTDSFLKLKKTFRLGSKKIRLMDFSDFSNNIFQVAEEISIHGKYVNSYDVVLLVNGIPIVQIELKKSGGELLEAFGQVIRYKSHSHQNLFDFLQLFAISNKSHTRYFLNTSDIDFKDTFIWENELGQSFESLAEFADSFLMPENIIDILNRFVFIDYFNQKKVLLKPHQINSIKRILIKINDGENGYIWHTYGSGKTLTSLHLAMLLERMDEIDKVVYITRENLSKFPQDYVSKSSAELTDKLVDEKLIITSINHVFTRDHANKNFDDFKDDRIIFIYDEYEKEQPRWNPLVLMEIFKNSLFYCFTGAPIFNENIKYDLTTKYIFGDRIDSYILKDSLMDRSSLNVQVSYLDDEKNKKSHSKKRTEDIAENILENFDELSKDKKFNAVLIVDSNRDVIDYYELFKNSGLNSVPILRFNINEEYGGLILRDYFEEECVDDFNAKFCTDLKSFTSSHERLTAIYENSVVEKMRGGEIDLLILDKSIFSNQFKLNILAGLDSYCLNSVYVDTDLEYEDIIRVISLVNYPFKDKLYGNIVLFRDIEENLNEALKLFSNETSDEDYELKPLKFYKDEFDKYLLEFENGDHDSFIDEFKKLSNLHMILSNFTSFEFTQLELDKFNKLKADYQMQMKNILESREELDGFNLSKIKKFKVNLDYIDSLFKSGDENISLKQENNQYNNVVNNYYTENNQENYSLNAEFNQTNNDISIVNENKFITINNTQKIYVINSNEDESSKMELDEDLEKSINSNKFILENIISHDTNEVPELTADTTKRIKKPKFDIRNDFLICDKCNVLYDSSDTYCIYCGAELKGLKEFDDFKKVCLNCKHLINDEEAVFCTHCGDSNIVDLEQYLFDLTKICPNCKKRHVGEDNYCKYCKTPLKDFKIYKDVNINKLQLYRYESFNFNNHKYKLNSFNEILAEDNFNKLDNFNLTSSQYDQIIENIELASSKVLNDAINENFIDIESISPFEKILLYAKSFTTVEFKYSGSSQGNYVYNKIQFEERDCKSQQIATLIHELSHHLLFEIFMQVLMMALDAQKTDNLEFFNAFTLGLGQNIIMDEYCAHTVQGRFIPRGFQEYGSFENIINEFNLQDDAKIVSYYALAGNSFAKDIQDIIGEFIDYDLREDIKEQFKLDMPLLSKSDGVLNEFEDVFDSDEKLKFIMSTFKTSFEIALKNPEILDKLKFK